MNELLHDISGALKLCYVVLVALNVFCSILVQLLPSWIEGVTQVFYFIFDGDTKNFIHFLNDSRSTKDLGLVLVQVKRELGQQLHALNNLLCYGH